MNSNLVQNDSRESNEIDFMAIIYLVRSNIWLILSLVLLSFSLGVLYCVRQVPQYQSHVLIQIETKQPGFGQNMAQQFALGNNGTSSTASQIALIQSPFILDPVIQRLGLDINAMPYSESIWQRIFKSPRHDTIKIAQFTVPKALINTSMFLKVTNSNQISLYDSHHQLLLQGFVGQLISNSDKSIQLKVTSIHASKGVQFKLTKSSESAVIADILKRLKITEAAGSFRESTGIVDISLTGSNVQQVLHTLNMIAKITRMKDAQKKSEEASQTLDFLYHQLPLTKRLLEKAENALNQYRAKSGKIDIKLQTQFYLNQLTSLDTHLGQLRIKKLQLLQKYTQEHPRMQTLKTQMLALIHQRDVLKDQIRLLPASDQVALNFMRDVSVKKTLYMILLNKIQELRVIKAGTVSSVRILNDAQLPDHPLPLKRGIICFAFFMIGLIFSILIIFARKALDRRIFDPYWSERRFNVPNLAIVPFSQEQLEKNRFAKSTQSKKQMLLAHENPRSLSVESLRSLRTSMQVSLLSASNNIVSILGVTPGVGKSFTASNLAYLLAVAGKKVILIDGDLRKGTIHKYFDVQPSPGLAEVLNQTNELSQVIQTNYHPNLFFIARGSYPKDPSELLMSDYFKTIIQRLSQQFDVVIIDTPPVLLVTDAVVISAFSSINYLVLGAGTHEDEDIETALKRLDISEVKVQGTIFNFNREEKKRYINSYGNYGRYGRYGKYSKYNYYYDAAETN